MDGLLSDAQRQGDPHGHLLVLATSNAPWDLDEALRRRLEKRIYIPLPEAHARYKMFERSLREINVGSDLDFSALAEATENYSGADIQHICRDAAMQPMRRAVDGLAPAEILRLRNEGQLQPGRLPVTMADFRAALASIQPSVAAADCHRYLDWAQDFGSK